MSPPGRAQKMPQAFGLNDHATQEDLMTIPVIPDGEPCNRIELTLQTGEQSWQQQLRAYCRYTKFVLRAGEDGSFVEVERPEGDDDKLKYQATISDDGNVVEIDVHNAHRVSDPSTSRAQVACMAQLAATFQAADGSKHRIPLLLVAPPYRWVDVRFSIDADGKGIFEYGQDIDNATDPPSIRAPRDGAVYFTLEGAEFFREEPFYFDMAEPDSCIVDIGTNGNEAILTNLHADVTDPRVHSFYIQVIDATGKLCRSGDPTIVNVSASDPPIGSSGA
jgi:hypothetical protein